MDQPPSQTVCVLVPCYNGLPYITEALDSALAQTHKPQQIVVVDDGSKDASAQVVRDYIKAHPDSNIELVQRPNGGEPAARNTGLKAARTTWVAMLDSDDWWDPRKLELQLAAVEKAGPDCVLVHTGVIHHFADGRIEPKDMAGPGRRIGWCTQALLEPTSIGHPSIMVRRDALEKIGGYDETFKQACDIDLYLRISVVGTFAFVPEHLLHYRIHPGQMSRSPVDQIMAHHRAVRRFFAAHPDWRDKIGATQIDRQLAQHVEVKLQSLYWRRQLLAFRSLLAYADEQKLDSPGIKEWRQRSRWPDWLILFKDRLSGKTKAGPGGGQAVGT